MCGTKANPGGVSALPIPVSTIKGKCSHHGLRRILKEEDLGYPNPSKLKGQQNGMNIEWRDGGHDKYQDSGPTATARSCFFPLTVLLNLFSEIVTSRIPMKLSR